MSMNSKEECKDHIVTKDEIKREDILSLLQRWLEAGECLAEFEDEERLGDMWVGSQRCNNKPYDRCGCIMCDVRQLVAETKKFVEKS